MNKMLFPRTCVSIFGRRMCSKPVPTNQTEPVPSVKPGRPGSMVVKYSPTNFQKILLVWTKKFKTKEEIPDLISPELIERARSEARIKIANYMMILTALASIGAILSGKAAAKRGESIETINQEFHKQYRENYKRQEEAEAAAAALK